jgi:hypothetical protein
MKPRVLRFVAHTFLRSLIEPGYRTPVYYQRASNHDTTRTDDVCAWLDAEGYATTHPDGTRSLTESGRAMVREWYAKHEPWRLDDWRSSTPTPEPAR